MTQRSGAALITGANSALGRAFARRLAAQGYRLVLTGRNEQQLAETAEELEQEFAQLAVEIILADLTVEDDRQVLIDRLRSDQVPVRMLVNNAGIGVAEQFHESDWDREQQLITVNYTAPMQLIHEGALPGFLGRGGGQILNVCSISGLMPEGSYGASKAGLVAFSRWAHVRYKPEGIHVLALCPGLLHTDFHAKAGTDVSGRPEWAFTEVDEVVAEGLAALAEGKKSVLVPGRTAKLLAGGSRLLPDRLVAGVTKKRRLNP